MGNFRSDRQGGFRDRPSDRFGGRSRGFGRDSGRRSPEMHNVICDKCGKQCQVPFKPTGDKPVFCSECFKQSNGSRNRDRQSGISSEQFNQLNAKIDKIIEILQDLEIDIEEDNSETDSKRE